MWRELNFKILRRQISDVKFLKPGKYFLTSSDSQHCAFRDKKTFVF
jgi:hypothetical protein